MKQLARLTEEIQTFQWPSEAEAPFRSLKKALCTAPALSYLQPGYKFHHDTDASSVLIRAVM